MSQNKVLIIIPCYNEQGGIAELLREINKFPEYDAIVVDDGSKDRTYQISSQLSPTVKLLRNLGIGGAVQAGIKYAYEKGYDFCVQIDGDGQHPPSEIGKLLQAYSQKSFPIIIGSRYLQKDTNHFTWARQFGSKIISKVLKLLFPRILITDPTSGMRLLDRHAIHFLAEHYPHDLPEPISLAWALKEGINVFEIPVQMRERMQGRSSIMGFKPIAYMLRVLGYIILAKIYSPTNSKMV
jgi:glycosyltransferase involved in cell wall biosynthesis